MSEEQSRLLADIRELTVEMESPRLSLQDQDYLKLCADILKQVRADGVPMHPVVEFVKSYHDTQKDNDGQSVIYLDDATGDICPECDADYISDDYTIGCASCLDHEHDEG